MHDHPLDNPIWNALRTDHSHFAVGDAGALRYPGEVAPFVGIPTHGVAADESLTPLLADSQPVYLLGQLPAASDRWSILLEASVVQMTCPAVTPQAAPMEFRELREGDVEAMLELTALVFPGYFRQRTLSMGRYLGVFADDVLVAMAGERMSLRGYREISAVCTRPGFTGRGYAGALVCVLAQAVIDQGAVPFLHVSPENRRARDLYRSLGFFDRCELPLVKVRTGGGEAAAPLTT